MSQDGERVYVTSKDKRPHVAVVDARTLEVLDSLVNVNEPGLSGAEGTRAVFERAGRVYVGWNQEGDNAPVVGVVDLTTRRTRHIPSPRPSHDMPGMAILWGTRRVVILMPLNKEIADFDFETLEMRSGAQLPVIGCGTADSIASIPPKRYSCR